MRIGVVTPAFNVARYIGDSIRSVLAQTHQDWTMTVVDDGSTDHTASIAGGFDEPRLRLIRQPNAGVSAARNRGATMTQEVEAVLFLDADDWLAPQALATLAAALQAAPEAIAAVGAYRRVRTGEPNRVSGRIRGSRPAGGDLLEALLVRNLFANGGHVLIRCRVLQAAGPFNPALSYGEDWEYWTRLARLGTFAAVPSSAPLLLVRERQDGAYRGMAARPEAFLPCMDAIFDAPELKARFGAATLAGLRRQAQAENDWVVGRELIRHGRLREGRNFLRRSVVAAPSVKRLALLIAASLPLVRVGPFRSYPVPDQV